MKAATSGLQYGSIDSRGRSSLSRSSSKKETSSRSRRSSDSPSKSEGSSRLRRSSDSPSKSEDSSDVERKSRSPSRTKSQESRKRLGRSENGSNADSQESSSSKESSKQRKTSAAKNQSDGKSKDVGRGSDQGFAMPADIGAFPTLMKLTEALPSEKENVFRRKMQACSIVYDFRVDTFPREKEAKRCTLLELIDYISTSKDCFNEQLMRDALEMVSCNIFRTLELRERSPILDLEMEEEEVYMDLSWPHLSLVYDFLLRFVISKELDGKRAGKYLDTDFILKLLLLFDTDDPRERDSLKMIMLRIYSRFANMRTRLRLALCDACLRAAYESDTANGIAELLEIQSKVISGFGTPLKDEHREVLTKVLIPLHKVSMLSLFHRQLCNCMLQFVEKERELCYDITRALLGMWPVAQATKQVLFINEVEEILNVMRASDFVRMQDAFVQRLALCITCQHSQVAESAMSLWKNKTFEKLIYDSREALFPIIISALYRNATQHWYGTVHERTFEVLKLMMEADERLFDESSAKHRKKGDEEENREVVRNRRWTILQEMFQKKEKARQLAELAAPKKKASAKRGEARAKRAATDNEAKRLMTISRREVVSLPKQNYGVAISSDELGDNVDLQALVVDAHGKIINCITAENFMAMKAAVVHTSNGHVGKHQLSQTLADEGEDAVPNYKAIIWVTLPRLPSRVKIIVFVATVSTGSLRDIPGGKVHILEEAWGNDIACFKLDSSSAISLLAVIERTAPDTWGMAKIASTVKAGGRNYWDILEPNLGSVVREAIPQAARPQRVEFSLEKCALAYLPQPLAPRGVFIGVGWDFLTHQLAVDVAAVLFNANGHELGAVSSETPEDRGVRHSGSGIVSAGVAVNMDAIPTEVVQIFIIANVAALGMNYEQVQNPCCRMIDHTGAEVVSYLHQEGGKKPGLILARLCRETGDRRWSFQAIGTFCSGHTWKESVKDIKPIFSLTGTALQHQPENSAPAAPTPSGRLMLSL